MKNSLKLEEAFLFALGVWLFSGLSYDWWLFLVLLLTPDISMIGYAVNSKTGAYSYNLFHHKGAAIVVYFVGIVTGLAWVQLMGIILFSHSSLDRIFGFGLKYPASFDHTHLGRMGPERKGNTAPVSSDNG